MSEKESEGSLSRIADELKELNANIKRLADLQEKRATFRQQRPSGERNMSGGGERGGRYGRPRTMYGERNMSGGGERGGRYGRPRTMYKVTCSDCGKETEVPFKPTGDRPVYCRDCFQKHRT